MSDFDPSTPLFLVKMGANLYIGRYGSEGYSFDKRIAKARWFPTRRAAEAICVYLEETTPDILPGCPFAVEETTAGDIVKRCDAERPCRNCGGKGYVSVRARGEPGGRKRLACSCETKTPGGGERGRS